MDDACKVVDIRMDADCEEAIQHIRNGEKYKYLLLGLREGPQLHLDDYGYMHEGVERTLSRLRSDQCYYMLYFDDHSAGKGELVLVAWLPRHIQNCESDLYHRALMIVKALLKVEHLLILNDGVVSSPTFKDSIRKTLACARNKNIVRVPALDHPIDVEGLGCLYFKRMFANRAKIAQIDAVTGKSTTHGELLRDSIRLAMNMKERGIGRGDIVTICSIDNDVVAMPTYATLFLGATVSALDVSFSLNDFVNSLGQIAPKIMFVESKAVDKVERALEIVGQKCELVVIGKADVHTPFSSLIQPVPGENDFRPIPAKSLLDTAYIVFTSGSTGVPKTICHNHHALQFQLRNFISTQFCWDLVLHYSTPYWTLYTKFLGMATILGTSRLIYPDFSEKSWHFTKYKVTFMFLSVSEITSMCAYERPRNVDLSGLKIMVGGNVINNDHLKKLEKVFYDTEIYLSYGMTEVPCGLTTFKPNTKLDRELKKKYPTSVGLSVSGLSYKIVDPETEEILGPNKKGELRIKTPFPLSGYFKVQPSSLWDSFGWLKSGDLAYYTEDHCFYVVDRIKNMFKYKDYHIVPSVLERALESHPSVRKAAVIGLPDEENGHLPLGVVILKSTQESVTGSVLQAFVDGKVADYERLRGGVKIVDKFPTTSTGKIRKWLLQNMIINAN
ncbi:luciferin 4-monooxygenase-like isoform X2 [Photinus pyralis]|uniref:luciferin 4-monooxygenase-like isoform X2 n=1 Tax=Photinus pyralis TaxID=7054 RepID=UPI0012677481|nr:luciferin 4-monooxygenase-like isoform X2 [Photinus pyralis]